MAASAGRARQLDAADRFVPLDWVEVVQRIRPAFPLAPGFPRSLGVEVGAGSRTHPARELQRALADDQVMIVPRFATRFITE
jgi:hypothetical protein